MATRTVVVALAVQWIFGALISFFQSSAIFLVRETTMDCYLSERRYILQSITTLWKDFIPTRAPFSSQNHISSDGKIGQMTPWWPQRLPGMNSLRRQNFQVLKHRCLDYFVVTTRRATVPRCYFCKTSFDRQRGGHTPGSHLRIRKLLEYSTKNFEINLGHVYSVQERDEKSETRISWLCPFHSQPSYS
jgi:hypothetical protein